MILLEFGRVIGCSAVGPWNAFTSVQQAIADEKKMTQSMIHSFLETGEVEFYQDEGGVASWPATAIICNCTKANKGNISDAIVKGALDLDMLGKETGAGTVCGSCQPLLKELLGFRETNPDAVERPKKSKRLLVSSFLAILLVLSIFFIPGIEPGNSVQTFQYKLTKIWTDSLWKQVTGYSLLTLSLFALLLSVRKRLKFFNVLNFGSWRRIHSILGLATLLVLLFHTGLHLGDNLNLWLMICFLGLNLLGAFSAITVAMENHWTSARSRMYRHYLTRLHIIFFWPYPVLLGYHIFKAYYY
jgi:nitrite reductase (NADH) large subunit